MREILELLERDAHLSHDTIATMTGLPVDQVTAQVTQWQANGVIRRYTAVVDWDRAAATGEEGKRARAVTRDRRCFPRWT